MPEDQVNIQQLLQNGSHFGTIEVSKLRSVIASNQYVDVRREVNALQSSVDSNASPSELELVKVGISSYLMGDHRKSENYLSRVKNDAVGTFYHACVLNSLGRHDEAAKKFHSASQLGYDRIECALRQAGTLRENGQLDDAEQMLRSVAAEAASRAEYSYQMGCILSDRGDTYGAIEYFERAVDMNNQHSPALFRLAAENALRGNDHEAIRLYEQALSKPPYFLGALMNLGLLYEDNENYNAAAFCFRKVLDSDPSNERAKLYLKDIRATEDMFYDEESAKNEARMEQLLGRPITDFELSVRSRNCLQAMDIHTLGDLTTTTEQDLLGGKNFGETSLKEIREMLTAHSLSIGQNLKKKTSDTSYQMQNLSPQEQMMLNKPISELELSVRARKCMSRLNMSTIGDLIQKTPDELLSSRNFGVTSLNEIRAKLQELNLSLRND
ncbi:MAG: tetratricopeptide repeat protein [Planctomycetaceae bacterium]|nr:tetratricopeptide repeat protein [Planctomycetaceae bacterium]